MIIGIDLGTTYSAAAYIDDDGSPKIIENRDGNRTTPSVVMFEDGDVCVGEQAKMNCIVDPENVAMFVKRQMGNENFIFINDRDEKYSAEDISAMILKRVKEDSEAVLGEQIRNAVVTVPAYFNDAQRKATMDAGRIAGLNVRQVINEPTAAAIAFGFHKKLENSTILVFDLGGGTFDVTIVRYNNGKDIEIISTYGNRELGGFDFDNEIVNFAVEKFKDETGVDIEEDLTAMQALRERAETTKRSLSTRDKAALSVTSEGKTVKVEITREQFNERIAQLLKNAQAIMETAMDDAKLNWSQIDKILLVGGSTRVPAVQKMIRDVTGIEPSHEINPDEAVAMGAALYADTLSLDDDGAPLNRLGDEIKISDVNSHSLGVLSIGQDDKQVNTIIIKRNSKLPVESSSEFSTRVDNQTAIQVTIMEGEESDPEYCTQLGESTLVIKPHPAGSPVRVTMQYDIDGIVHVRVFDLVDNVDLGEVRVDRKANLTDAEIRQKESRIAQMNID